MKKNSLYKVALIGLRIVVGWMERQEAARWKEIWEEEEREERLAWVGLLGLWWWMKKDYGV